MILTAIEINNFKCFRETEVPLSGLTVFCGGNGAGKSSAIQALLISRHAFYEGQKDRKSTARGVDANAVFDTPIVLNGKFDLQLGNSFHVTNSEVDSGKISINLIRKRHRPDKGIKLNFEADTQVEKTSILFQESPAKRRILFASQNISLFHENFHYLKAERVGPRQLYELADQRYNNTGYDGAFTAQAIDMASRNSAKISNSVRAPSEEASDLFKVNLDRWMHYLVPGVQFQASPLRDVNSIKMGIRNSKSGTDYLLPSNIGFGISYSLPIIVSGLLSDERSMLIVENPEAHLHPASQSRMGEFLACVASTGCQVVVETHSEHIINGIRVAAAKKRIATDNVDILYFQQPEQGSQPSIDRIKLTSEVDLSVWPKGFFDQQSEDLKILFMARRSGTLNDS